MLTKRTKGVRGLPYMMSAVGGGRGSPKSRQKERGCMNYVRDKGGRVKKSEYFADVIHGRPQFENTYPKCAHEKISCLSLVIGD